MKTPFVKSALISFVPMPSSDEVVKTNDPAIVSGFGLLSVNVTLDFTQVETTHENIYQISQIFASEIRTKLDENS